MQAEQSEFKLILILALIVNYSNGASDSDFFILNKC